MNCKKQIKLLQFSEKLIRQVSAIKVRQFCQTFLFCIVSKKKYAAARCRILLKRLKVYGLTLFFTNARPPILFPVFPRVYPS